MISMREKKVDRFLEVRIFVPEAMGRDNTLRLDQLGYRWEAACWKAPYTVQRLNEAIWLLERTTFMNEMVEKPIVVLFNTGKEKV